jgi:pSer/pThr/pTyr-binding forkhead associated (FHA) protein
LNDLTFVLRFISGKYRGGEFVLPTDKPVIIGRAADVDMVLIEDMVSRNHSRIAFDGTAFVIEDLGSTNGTFVNGERVTKRALAVGDRVLVGTSILELRRQGSSASGARPMPASTAPTNRPRTDASAPLPVANATIPQQAAKAESKPSAPAAAPDAAPHDFLSDDDLVDDEGGISQPGNAAAKPLPAPAAAPTPTAAPAPTTGAIPREGPSGMTGALDEVSLPDLIQLFAVSRKTGVLHVVSGSQEGALFLHNGQVTYAQIAGSHEPDAKLTAFAILGWTHGSFELRHPKALPTFRHPITLSTQALLMEAAQFRDEMGQYSTVVPGDHATITLAKPPATPLRDLAPAELDALERALVAGDVKGAWTGADKPKNEVYRDLASLKEKGVIDFGE